MAEAITSGRVKGGIISAHLDWAEERLGKRHLTILSNHLPAESALILDRGFVAFDWHPFSLLINLDRAIAAAVGDLPTEVYKNLGRHSARFNLHGVYKAFTRDGAHEFFSQEAIHHRQFLDTGSATYTKTGATSCTLRIDDMSCFSSVFCASAEGYYEEAVALHKGQAIRVDETSCRARSDHACIFEISWL